MMDTSLNNLKSGRAMSKNESNVTIMVTKNRSAEGNKKMTNITKIKRPISMKIYIMTTFFGNDALTN